MTTPESLPTPPDAGPPLPRMRGFAGVDAEGTPRTAAAAPPGAGSRRPGISRAFAGVGAGAMPEPPALPGAGARRAPPPKRPKGRFLIGTFLLALFAAAGYAAWNGLLRYDAYGEITGRIIHVPTSQGGTVHAIHVREGEHVAQGQLLITLENVELTQRLARIGDELLLAQGNLDAELSKLQWQSQQQADLAQRTSAEYFELWGDLVQQESKLEELQLRLDRDRALVDRGALSREQLEETHFAVTGQQGKINKLREALAERKKLADVSVPSSTKGQLKPLLLKIETLQAEFARLRALVEQGQIRAPVGGKIVRSRYFMGEQVEPLQTVLEILEQGSLEAVIYLPQGHAGEHHKFDQMELRIEPLGETVTCHVDRFAERHMTVPESLQSYYRKGEQVLPMYVRFQRESADLDRLRLGSGVQLPAQWPKRLVSQAKALAKINPADAAQ